MNNDYKNILVVNANGVGDVIFTSPVFKALKESFVQAHVACLPACLPTRQACLAAPRVKEILESCPFIDGII